MLSPPRHPSPAEVAEQETQPVVRVAGWDRSAAEEQSYHHPHPYRELGLVAEEGVGWALLVEAVETLWDLLLLAGVAAMAAAVATVVPAEERAPGWAVATP